MKKGLLFVIVIALSISTALSAAAETASGEGKASTKASPKASSKTTEKPSADSAKEWRQSQLDRQGRSMYDSFVKDLTAMKTTATASYSGSSALDAFPTIVELIKKNHPELFWISYDEQNARGNGSTVTWKPSFYKKYVTDGKLDRELIKEEQAKIKSAVKSVGVGENAYESVKKINSWLCENVKYSFNYSDYNVYELSGSLVNGVSACEGFAKAVQYLCDEAGVSCVTVSGKGTMGGVVYEHAWNYIQMDDGKWYMLDSTWNALSGNKEKWLLLGSGANVDGMGLLASHKPYSSKYPALATGNYGG